MSLFLTLLSSSKRTTVEFQKLFCLLSNSLQVTIGNLDYELGRLQYQKLDSDAAEYWIVGVAMTGGAMLTIIFIILVVYKRKSTRAQRQFKRLQLQLDSLESNIRNECKQGAQNRFSEETGKDVMNFCMVDSRCISAQLS